MSLGPDRRTVAAGLLLMGPGTGAQARTALAGEGEALVTFNSAGRPINSIIFRPDPGVERPDRRAGVVLMHGAGGMQREYEGLKATAQTLSRLGFVVLVPSYFEAHPDDGIRSRRVMDLWRGVCVDSVNWLIEQGVQHDRVGVWGVSLGGYVAVDGALGGGRAAAAVSVVSGTAVYTPRRSRRNIPVLMIYGERDEHVPPSSTQSWADMLRRDNVPVAVRRIDEAGHIFNRAEWATMLTMTVEFFQRTLVAPAESAT